jgi:ligand-binding sensor domain-containing protein/signal transduction histidine kinase
MIKTAKKYFFFFVLSLSLLYPQSFVKKDEPKRLTQYVRDLWQVKEGLPQNSINAIVQTRDGYLWLGTYEGLVRFNGKTFTVFDRGNTPVFQSNRITALCEDKNGRLWIGSYGGGVTLYDGKRFSSPIRDTAFGKYINIASLTADSSGRVWAITENGVFALRDSVIERTYPRSLFHNTVPFQCVSDGHGRVWVSAYPNLYIISSENVRTLKPKRLAASYSAVAPSHNGSVWLFEHSPHNTSSVWRYDDSLEFVCTIPRSLISLKIAPMYEDSHGVLWCYVADGFATYHNGRWDHLGKRNNFSFEYVQQITSDRENNLWIGSNGNGLLRLRDARFTPIGIAEGLRGENVWSVFEDSRGTQWIGTLGSGGWCYAVDHNGIHPVTNRAGIYFCFLEDKERNVWLAGESLVLPNGKRRILPSSWHSSVLAVDSSGRVWLSPYHGGIYIVANEKIVDSLSLGSSSADLSIRTMKTDRDGSMWIGTQSGLFHYQRRNITQFTTADGLPNNWIRSIYQDSDGVLWIATDGGLAKMINGQFQSYTVLNGLYSNTIHVILEDDSNSLWMSSNKGVFVVRKKDIQLFDEKKIAMLPCVVYGEEDGMRSAEGNGSYQQGGWKMHDGTLWFATIKGVAVVDPKNLKKNDVSPPVYIENIIVNGEQISRDALLELRYPVSDITFYYTALSYRVNSRVRYQYKLEGYHNDWVDAGNQTRAEFTNLPAGDFVFRVRACNDDGVWNTAGASMSFTLPAPFWQTWWFFTVIGLAVFSSLAGTIRYVELRKVKRRIEQLEQEKALERERIRISKDMHDEVGASLTKIAILSELAARQKQEAERHLINITETSREVIDNMGQIIWAINPKNDKLENLAAYLREYIAETCEMANIRYMLSFPEELPPASLSAEFRRNIFLTVKEAVNNIVKYSKANQVQATLQVAEHEIFFLISDNGIGFDLANVSQFGNGLQNMKKRIEDLGGTLTLESYPGNGTTLSFSVRVR